MIEFYLINFFLIIGSIFFIFFLSQENNKGLEIITTFIFSIPYIIFVGFRILTMVRIRLIILIIFF